MNDIQTARNKKDEVEISLGDMLWFVLGRWRFILIMLLVFGILLGGSRGLSSWNRMRNTAANEAAAEMYREAMEDYETKLAAALSRVDTLVTEMAQQDSYRERSQLFNIDPYNAFVSEAVYYVKVEETAGADAYYRSLNNTAMLVEAYGAAARKADLSTILAAAGYENESGFISLAQKPAQSLETDQTTVSVYNGDAAEKGVFTLRAIGADREQADAILAAAEAQLEASRAELTRAICRHELVRLAESRSQTVEEGLIALHAEFDEKALLLTNGLNTAQTELEKLTVPSSSETTMGTVVRQAVKYCAVGAVVGAFLAVCFFVLVFVFKNAVAGPDDLRRRYGGELLGAVPLKKKRSALDRSILRRRGVDGDRGEKLRYLAESLRHAAAGAGGVLLISDRGAELSGEIAGELAPLLEGVKLESAGNICENVEAVCAFNEAERVVLIEQLDKSRHAEIRRALDKTLCAEKKCLGFVLVD